MMHLETIESRRLMAGTGLDQTFGTNGTVILRGVSVGNAVVSFPGGMIVEAKSRAGTDYLYKLTSAGRIDTSWGDNGRVTAPNFDVDALAYDKRHGLLYAAGVTKRFTDAEDATVGNTATLRVQRFSATTGYTDTTFGDNGVASFAYGKSNTTFVNELNVSRLLPLAKRGLAVVFEHVSYEDGFASPVTSVRDVTLLKYNASGTRDAAFGRRGIGNVTSGIDIKTDTPSLFTEQANAPHFADLQARADGSFRVITWRRRGTRTVETNDEAHETVNVKFLVQSQVLSPVGTLDVTQDHVWRVALTTPDEATGIVSGEYTSLLVKADGDNGAIAVGRRQIYDDIQYEYSVKVQTATLTPAARTIERLHVLDDRIFDAIVPFARGYFAVVDFLNEVDATKLRSDFRLSPTFNSGAETRTPVADDSDGVIVTDIDGNLLVLHANQITRISG